ncbi:MAG: YbaK/EbsC family protein [Candidatus Nanohaloarchaea archaeon]
MRADSFLDAAGIDYEIVEHGPVETCSEAADARDVDPGCIVKSLVVERDGQLYHVCIPGDRKLSGTKFGEHRMVPPGRSEELTGQESGTVHPFSTELPHVVDERLFEQEELSHTVGNRKEGVVYPVEGFRAALEELDCEVEVKDIVVTDQRDRKQLENFVDEEDANFLLENGYRGMFLELADKNPATEIVEAIRKLNRQETGFSSADVKELVKRAENDTHMLKLAERFAEDGSFPDRDGEADLEKTVSEVVDENPDAVKDYRDGKDSAINYLLGQVMQETRGKADGGEARELLMEEL